MRDARRPRGREHHRDPARGSAAEARIKNQNTFIQVNDVNEKMKVKQREVIDENKIGDVFLEIAQHIDVSGNFQIILPSHKVMSI